MAKILKEGDTFIDHETGNAIIYNSDIADNYEYMVISVLSKNRLKYGWAKKTLHKNILVTQYSPETKSYIKKFKAISLSIFAKENICWNNINGAYIFSLDVDYIKCLLENNRYTKGKGVYPYTVDRNYDASGNMKLFTKNIPKYDKIFNEKIIELIPYTFGLEYETSEGIIPEEICFKTGLIPLRDGSITGNEYSSIVLNSKRSGFEIIKKELEVLTEYTSFDKECSLHIHFGNIKISPANIYALYLVCFSLQEELSIYLPKHSFNTAAYKKSQKNYCNYLPKFYNKFNDLYSFLSGTSTPYLGSLECAHPRDPSRTSKWNINTRYYWVNFINLCFYKSPKTIEFRILRPTYNFNKIINFIYIFSAIIKYCENISKDIESSCVNEIRNIILSEHNNISLQNILNEIYPLDVSGKLLSFLNECKQTVDWQSNVGDKIGAITEKENCIITKNVLE